MEMMGIVGRKIIVKERNGILGFALNIMYN